MGLLLNQWSHNIVDWQSYYRQIQYDGYSGVPRDAPGHIDVVPDPAGGDFNCFRVTTNITDAPIGGERLRTELVPKNDTDQASSLWSGFEAERRWYRFAVYMDPDVWDLEPSFVGQRPTMFQIHERHDTSPLDAVVSPSFFINEDPEHGGRWLPRITWCSAAQTTTTSEGGANNYNLIHHSYVPMAWRRWQDWVVYRNYAWDNTGEMMIWVDGRPVVWRIGMPNGFNNDVSRGGGEEYAKFGIYYGNDPSYGPAKTTGAILWHRGLQIADEEITSFNLFMEALGESTREREAVHVAGVSL